MQSVFKEAPPAGGEFGLAGPRPAAAVTAGSILACLGSRSLSTTTDGSKLRLTLVPASNLHLQSAQVLLGRRPAQEKVVNSVGTKAQRRLPNERARCCAVRFGAAAAKRAYTPQCHSVGAM